MSPGGAQVVLADGSVVDCDHEHEPHLFWALRGAGGQFGVVTSLRFDTVDEPVTTRIEEHWSDAPLAELVSAWQAWAPDVPDELSVNLTQVAQPGTPVRATLFGACTLAEGSTRELLGELIDRPGDELRTGLPYSQLKDLRRSPGRTRTGAAHPVGVLLPPLVRPHPRIAADPARRPECRGPTAAHVHRAGRGLQQGRRGRHRVRHRGERFLSNTSPTRPTRGSTAPGRPPTPTGSGRVYPNFPDPALDDWAVAYHAGNHPRPAAVKNAYDPRRFFDSRKPSDQRQRRDMSRVISAHAVSVDGYLTGRDPDAGRGLGDGTMLFDWYFDGDTPSRCSTGSC